MLYFYLFKPIYLRILGYKDRILCHSLALLQISEVERFVVKLNQTVKQDLEVDRIRRSELIRKTAPS